MRILIAISLSLLVFFQSVGIGVSDVLRMSDLVEHAKFHSEEYGDNFFTFFQKHYSTLKAEHQKTHQEEKSQHEKLPFQHYNFNHSLTEILVTGNVFSLKKSAISDAVRHHFYYQDLYSFLERASIFQPPKIA